MNILDRILLLFVIFGICTLTLSIFASLRHANGTTEESHRIRSATKPDRKSRTVCVYTTWGKWSPVACICDNLEYASFTQRRNATTVRPTRTRYRQILSGTACGPLTEVWGCSCTELREHGKLERQAPTDVNETAVSEMQCVQPQHWERWEPCTTSCGFGTQQRTRRYAATASSTACAPGVHHAYAAVHERMLQTLDIRRCGNASRQIDSPACPLQAHLPPPDVPRPPGFISCKDFHLVHVTDQEPFGKGFSKRVFRATLRGQNVVVKRPLNHKGLDRFMNALKWEDKWLAFFQHNSLFMKYFGMCSKKTVDDAFEVVEGNLVRWHFIQQGPLSAPWCFRINLALQVLAALRVFEEKKVIHCDWKYDQLAVDESGRIRIVDVKSFRWLAPGEKPYKSDRWCSKDSKCHTCMKTVSLPQESSCNKTSRRCVGYDQRSMISATSQAFLSPMFVKHMNHAKDRKKSLEIESFLALCADHDPNMRPNVSVMEQFFLTIYQKYDGDACMSRTNVSKIFYDGYRQMVANSSQCTKRYC
eukprot:m.368862 g.368862  ORF g.368862 m.368862 type:complete len:532 (-) comp20844_c0_seq1:68-1663(-)